MVAQRALQKAEDMEHERRKAFFKAMEAAVQNGVARAFS